MVKPSLHNDPLWPRAGAWPLPNDNDSDNDDAIDMVLVGVPTHASSLSPTRADLTPAAVRHAITRYSGHSVSIDGAISTVVDDALRIVDAGDLVAPDEREEAAITALAALMARSRLLVALGGDNALTVPVGLATFGDDIATAGLITFDAHHDLREGVSNGSPVRRLIEAGLDPKRIVQIGIADFANSAHYRKLADSLGITVIHRDDLHERAMSDVVAAALSVAGAGGGPVHVDVDVDVCDRSVAPGCPASVPGGLLAHELRRAVRLIARHDQVRSIDLAEIDASADTPDGRTVRLAGLLVLEAATGLAERDAQ